ncbi:MAG: hypothetical protein KC613_08080 [Myxococcales bacterium]|nr:hypothetical protein [Myxococcales bacterium]MCB9526438.1 hypothetical protein [Myxococcales bacterium]
MRTAITAALLLLATPALADDELIGASDAPLHELEPHYSAAALKFISMTLPAHPENPFWFGPGALTEFPIWHGLLEVEFAAALLVGEHGWEVPVDVILKVPYHFNHFWDVFAGVGPMVAWNAHGAGYGAIATVGGYAWNEGNVGLLLELDYTFLSHATEEAHGVEAAVGVALRY